MSVRSGSTINVIVTAAAIVAGIAIGGCGQTAKPRPVAPVQLTQLAPNDGAHVSSGSVTVSGSVSPRRSTVLVMGRTVTTSADGHFSTTAPLRVGTNLIDVIATNGRAKPAMTALRVFRYVLVAVPNVVGRAPKAAATAIRSVGLTPKVQGSSDPFNFLIPVSSQVCQQAPAPRTRVNPGTTVTLSIGKLC